MLKKKPNKTIEVLWEFGDELHQRNEPQIFHHLSGVLAKLLIQQCPVVHQSESWILQCNYHAVQTKAAEVWTSSCLSSFPSYLLLKYDVLCRKAVLSIAASTLELMQLKTRFWFIE